MLLHVERVKDDMLHIQYEKMSSIEEVIVGFMVVNNVFFCFWMFSAGDTRESPHQTSVNVLCCDDGTMEPMSSSPRGLASAGVVGGCRSADLNCKRIVLKTLSLHSSLSVQGQAIRLRPAEAKGRNEETTEPATVESILYIVQGVVHYLRRPFSVAINIKKKHLSPI